MWLTPLLLSFKCTVVFAWTTNELFIYDLVEEVGESFYDFYGISKDAEISQIKKAYRRLSMEWHPDRNSDEKAEEQFRKIAAIYEILKSNDLREEYDRILENGLPDWRQPVFYYRLALVKYSSIVHPNLNNASDFLRRARKLSWFEGVVVLTIICSIGHYFMLWGAYVDKYLTLSSSRSKLRKKEIRQLKKIGSDAEIIYEAKIAEMLSDVCPSWRNSLPVLIVSLLYNVAVSLPGFIRAYISMCQPKVEKSEKDDGDEVSPRRYVVTRQPIYEYAVASDVKPVLSCAFSEDSSQKSDSQNNNIIRNNAWTSEELALLIRLSTEKYPAGTPNRWELLAKALDRSPQSITLMVGKLKQMKKDEYANLLRSSQSSAVVQNAAQITLLKQSDHFSDEKSNDCNISRKDNDSEKEKILVIWSDYDQKLFETALQEFPKGTADRWDKIANCVSSKTKQQCIDRFRYLSEMVRQRKSHQKNK
uniref:DnaJ homolog subfamily C member 1 n=1 Tax=Elaeophora elaphi TaxID=1147741 RepID=A0A0R3S2B8_9BILA